MPDANSYAINLELSLDDKITSKLNRVKDSILNLDKDAVKSASKLNKTLYTINELQRLGADNVQALRTQYAKVAGITEDQLQQLLDLAKAQDDVNKLKKIEGNLLREANKEYDEMIQDGLEKIRVNTEIWKGRSEAVLGVLNSMGGSLSGLVGLGQEWSKTISTTSNILKLIDRFFLAGIKKRTSMSKKLYDIDIDGTKRTYQWKTKVEKQFIQSVLRSRKKQAKDIHKISMKELGAGGGAGGKGPGGPNAGALAEAAGAGGGGGMAFLASSGPYIAAAMAVVAVAIGSVVGAVMLLNKSLQLAAEQFENFHTINYLASGGAQVLSESMFTLGMMGINTTEELQKAANAIASLGYSAITASGEMNKSFMAMTNLVANYTRITGLAENEVASFISMQRGLGATFAGPGGTLASLYRLTSAMKKYGITAGEASSILKSAKDATYKLAITFNMGAKAASAATAAYSRAAAAAKQLGLDVEDSANMLNNLKDNMLDFIVVTGGKSLEGPISGLAAIAENIDNIEKSLPEDPLVRDILLKNVYKINEKDLKIAQKINKNFQEWQEDQLEAAIAEKKSKDEINRIQKLGVRDFLTAMEDVEDAASNIEKMAKESNNNIDRQWKLLKSMVLSVLGRVGSDLMPMFVNVGKILITSLSGLLEFVSGESLTGVEGIFDVLSNAADSSSSFARAIDASAKASMQQLALDNSVLKLKEKYESEQRAIDDKFINSMKASIDNKDTLLQLEQSKGSRLSAELYGTLMKEIEARQKNIAESGDLDFEIYARGQQMGDALADAAKGLQIRERKDKSMLERMIDTLFDVAIAIGMLVDRLGGGADLVQKATRAQLEFRGWLTDREITRIEAAKAREAKLKEKEAQALAKEVAAPMPLRDKNDKMAEEASNLAKAERKSKEAIVISNDPFVQDILSKQLRLTQDQLDATNKLNKSGLPLMDLNVW